MKFFLAMLAVALFLAGCGTTQTSLPGESPNILHVVRYNGLQKVQPVPPLDVTISDAAQVQRLYAALLAIPPAPLVSGPVNCPADFGISYSLTFFQDQKGVLSAEGDASG